MPFNNLEHLGKRTPTECLKAVRLETGTDLPRTRRELIEVIDFLKETMGKPYKVYLWRTPESWRILKPSGSIVRSCAELKNPRLIGLEEGLRGFETCVVIKQGVKVGELIKSKHLELNIIECTRYVVSGSLFMK